MNLDNQLLSIQKIDDFFYLFDENFITSDIPNYHYFYLVIAFHKNFIVIDEIRKYILDSIEFKKYFYSNIFICNDYEKLLNDYKLLNNKAYI